MEKEKSISNKTGTYKRKDWRGKPVDCHEWEDKVITWAIESGLFKDILKRKKLIVVSKKYYPEQPEQEQPVEQAVEQPVEKQVEQLGETIKETEPVKVIVIKL